jgi:uncharacterized membrane protein (UPF0127 family)
MEESAKAPGHRGFARLRRKVEGRRALMLAGLFSLFGGAAFAQGQLQTYAKSELTIVSASGKHRFAVEMALTPAQMEQGLMFRRSLPADSGMLFDYGAMQPVAFWMKNTLIPLDMIFIKADGVIAAIHERAVPLSLEPIPSPVPVRAVLEVNGGTAARLGLKPGDRVIHPLFEKTG